MIRRPSVAHVSLAAEHYQQAVRLYKQGDYHAAQHKLNQGFQLDVEYKPLYTLARDVLSKFAKEHEVRRLLTIALVDFNAFEPFFDLGYHFIETENYLLAAAFLARAQRLNPHHIDTAYELAFARMARFQIRAAIQALETVPYENDFWVAYLYYQCRLWLQQPDGVAEFVNDAQVMLASQLSSESLEIARYKIMELAESLVRYQALQVHQSQSITASPLPIRSWHFVQYGAAILDYCDEKMAHIAGGRYVALWHTPIEVRGILAKLLQYLTRLERVPERVIAVPDRDSEIIGRVLARLCHLPFALLETVQDFSNSLVVAADSRAFNGIEPLIEIQNRQTVFAMHQPWLERTMIVPDVVGMVSQHYYLPWSAGRLVLDQSTQEMQPQLADTRAIEVIVDELMTESISEQALITFEPHLQFYQQCRAWLKGGEQGGTQRSPYAIESPVAGEYLDE